MNKSREAFEQWFKTTTTYQNMLMSIKVELIQGDVFEMRNNLYRNKQVQLAWVTWQARQAEIDELKSEKSIQELEINQLGQANQAWQTMYNKQDKRIDAALEIICHLTDEYTRCELEQALRGEQ